MYEDDSGVDWFEWVLLNGWIIIALLITIVILLGVLVKRVGDLRPPKPVQPPSYPSTGWQTQPIPRQREGDSYA